MAAWYVISGWEWGVFTNRRAIGDNVVRRRRSGKEDARGYYYEVGDAGPLGRHLDIWREVYEKAIFV